MQDVERIIIQDTIREIIDNYWVDGIYFDDYFYPYDYPLPIGECRDGKLANNRREAINELIRQSYRTIKSVNKNIKFGVSPFGIWKNKSSDEIGSNTSGLEGYYLTYADSLKWINNNLEIEDTLKILYIKNNKHICNTR